MTFPDNAKFATVRLARLWLWPVAAGILLALALALLAPRARPSFVLAAYAIYGVLLLAALRSLQEAKIVPSELFGVPPGEVRVWRSIVLLVPIMFAFAAMSLWATAYAAAWLTPRFADYLFEQQRDAGPLKALSGRGSALLIVFIVVIGPVIEEFVFRGIVLRRWMARSGLWPGVIGSSVIFALLHPPFWIGAMVVGIFLSMLYLVTRSLYAPIAFHAMYNGLVTFATLGSERFATNQKEPTLAEFRSEWMGEVALLLISGLIIYRAIRRFSAEARRVEAANQSPPPAAPPAA